MLIYGYADDHAIRKNFTADAPSSNETMGQIQQTLTDIKTWMDANRLKMNNDKTKFIIFSSKKLQHKCQITNIDVNGTHVHRSSEIKYIGAHLDEGT